MRILATIFAALILAGSMPSISRAEAASELRLEEQFAGRTIARGHFRAINGVKRDFTVTLHGKWDGKTLALREDFVFDDGERDRKTWRFVRTGPGRYTGTREDVVGQTHVRIDANVARFSYLVYLDPGERKNKVRFHDTMTLNSDGTVLNTAWITKIGLPVAWTRVEFRRP
ncbi:DUF3833 family protein [Sinorhizobium sp. BG8]|uniref:DUF3833 family protein n=1 Tax=Sinorhizobium sp. BG8 TaxID=2613773 RepID=UPI00193DAA56|nr:DUF3833 family protein [Sinorhizobium sp. BG8]QRM57536.1 DUF3833 domain-containing protein [Sinorhizobium sp. BG8]